MKKYRATLVLVAVFAGLLGCWFYLNRVQQTAGNSGISERKTGSIVAIVVAGSDGSLQFVKQNKRWTMVKPFSYRLDQNRMEVLEDVLSDLSVLRVVEQGVRDFDKYGLARPALTISFKTARGETRTLMIGAGTVSKTSYYARQANRIAVFTLEKSIVDGFRGGPSDFRERNLIGMKPADIDSITIDTNRNVFRLVRDYQRKWRFVTPVTANVKTDAIKGLIEAVHDMRIRDFLAVKADNAEEYGLNHPACILTLMDRRHKTQSIYFGKEDVKKECIFIKVNDCEEVYTLSTKDFSMDRLKADSWLDVAPLSIGIGDVREIQVKDRGKTAEFSRAVSESDEDVFAQYGKLLNTEDFNTFYINLMALSAAGYDPGNKGTSPELTVLFKLKGNRMVQADFSERDQMSFFMTINGKPMPYYVTAEKITLVRKWLQRVESGS